MFCSVCSNFNIIPPSLLSQRIQRPRHCYFYSSFNRRQTKISKKMMQSAGGQTLSTTISKNLNPKSGTEPAGTSHGEIGFQSCFTSQQRTINKLPDLFFLAFLNCIDSNHLLIISLLGFGIKNKNNLFGNNIQILRIYMYEIV